MKWKLVLAAVACAAAVVAGVAPARSFAQVPLRGVFYYPWFPQAWTQDGIYPFTQYTPSLGFYDSSNQTLISKHVKALRYANVDFGVYSWWGTRVSDGSTQKRFPLYLKAAHGTPLKWAIYYEEEGYRDPTPAEIAADLSTVAGYASDKSYLRVDGHPVVFVYEGAGDGCATNDRWAQANASVGAYLVQDQVWVDTEPRLSGFTAADSATATSATRVAAADLDGDGRAEIVTTQGPGAPPQVRVWSHGTQTLAFAPYDPSFLGGVNVAAGDLTGDGRAEIVTAPESVAAGTTGTINVYAVSGGAATQLASFDSGLAGARVAVGDVNGDGKAEIVAAAGPGAAPMIRVFDASGTLLSQFGAYDLGYTGGVNVAVGNVAGDSRADIVTGTGAGADEVRVFDASGAQQMAPFAPYGGRSGGLSVAVGDTDGNGTKEIVTEAVGAPRILSFVTAGGVPSQLASFYAFDPGYGGTSFVASADTDANGRDDFVVAAPEQARQDQRAGVSVFGSVRDCATQPQSWHEYNFDATGVRAVPGQSVTISPGFFSRAESQPRVGRDLGRWTREVQDSVASQAPWQLVLSFNEWGEGTAVESAKEWATRSGYGSYEDVLHANP